MAAPAPGEAPEKKLSKSLSVWKLHEGKLQSCFVDYRIVRPSKIYRLRSVELGKFTAFVFQRKEDMFLEVK